MSKKIKSSFFESVFIIFFIGGIVFGFAWLLSQGVHFIKTLENDVKMQHFLKGNTLKCNNGTFSSQSFLVSKKYGWQIYKDEFKKDDILISIHRCKEEK